MVPFFRDTPIKKKLALLVLASCGVALLGAGVLQNALEFWQHRRAFARDISTAAAVMAYGTSTAVVREDNQAATEILGALGAKPNVLSASLWQPSGRLFAHFGELDDGATLNLATRPRSDLFTGFILQHFEPLTVNGQRIGTLYVRADFRPDLMASFKIDVLVFGLVATVTAILAFLVSHWLQRSISRPIRALANTAAAVANDNDYSVRAPKFANDEVGAFTDVFNHMLDEIERQDTALRHVIAERKRAEREVDQLHKRLLQASRQAGMAEVATGVLHNVGNVLNSVNVSAALLSEQVRKSRAQNVNRVAEMLNRHERDLGDYLTHDPKGRLLPEYLTELGQRLDAERTKTLAELESLSASIEHIKDIVAMQQDYARVSGVTETLPLAELVEDALRMNAAAFARHHVHLERDFAPVPAVIVDKHKVLQILTNLLRNAKYALDDSGIEPKTIRVSLSLDEEGFAQVIVADNGVGIAGENLTRIFAHGFTTRRDGHGFGLHSGALAAREMGGNLVAHSDGPGLGATFTLTLPTFNESPSTTVSSCSFAATN